MLNCPFEIHAREIFYIILDYEINCAMRYRRYLSLLFIHFKNKEYYKNVLLSVRDSDLIFYDEEMIYMLLPEINTQGIHALLQRFRTNKKFAEECITTHVTFPFDGLSGHELVSKGEQQMESILHQLHLR